MDILKLARAVKRGVKLLDKKVPNWRTVLRKHNDEFDLADSEYCVLGTLEHHSGRLKVLRAREVEAEGNDNNAFSRAIVRLNIDGHQVDADYGFNAYSLLDANGNYIEGEAAQMAALQDLWRAEFE